MSCVGIKLGFLCITYYGIIIMLGTLAAGYLGTIEVKRRGHDPELVWDLMLYLVIGGVLGARLWHVLTPPPSSLVMDPASGAMVNPYFVGGIPRIIDMLMIWNGGLGIPGAILGGLVAIYFYTRRNKAISFLEWTDIGAPSLALGQAIGRWGNFVNQELYGLPTNLPWKIYIDPARRLPGFVDESYYHPLFAYESILNLANMLFLLWVLRRFEGRLKRGDVFNLYLIFYPAVRFGLDFLRLDASQVFSININQTLMAVVCVAAVAVFLYRHRSGEASAEMSSLERSASPASTRARNSRATAARTNSSPSARLRRPKPRKSTRRAS